VEARQETKAENGIGMTKTFSVEDLLLHLRMHGRLLAIACGISFLLSLCISLLMTPKYTATVSIVIDPPANSDPRAATAISPMYLESLRTYESYAEGDSLFADAVAKYHLRTSKNQTIESLKQNILRVSKRKDSKILQIRVALPEPDRALAVARFIAGGVLSLNQDTAAVIEVEARRNGQKQLDQWQENYRKAQEEYTDFNRKWPVEALQSEVDSLTDVVGRVQQASIEAGADAEEYATREARPGAASDANRQAAALRARADILDRQVTQMRLSLAAQGAELSKRIASRVQLEAQVKMAQAGLDAEARHVREIQDATGGRGDVLTIIDRGILPERPTSPNVVLNVVASVFIALILSSAYLLVGVGRAPR
jgi:capsular polysaccharide biosynthesis protein